MKNDVIVQLDLPETDPNRPYIVYGPVRGLVSTHLTKAGAEASIARDRKAAKRTASPYDADIYKRVDGGWKRSPAKAVQWFDTPRTVLA